MPPRDIGLAARLLLTVTIATLAMGAGFFVLQSIDGTRLNTLFVILIAYLVMALAVWGGLSLIFSERDTSIAQPRSRRSLEGKFKRGPSMDMYELLDRLVGALTPDERAYLEQRLQDDEDGDENLASALEDLLAEREHKGSRR